MIKDRYSEANPMNADELRSLQAPLKDKYKSEPDAASATLFLDTCYSGGTRDKDTLTALTRPVMNTPKE